MWTSYDVTAGSAMKPQNITYGGFLAKYPKRLDFLVKPAQNYFSDRWGLPGGFLLVQLLVHQRKFCW